ncbi:hypothetical protein F5Y05DRAFT_423768 [Hypoxylon sp. FL0543]|nr:hypothetical protein F5Y05DRAFT_423768 [Hypoxylon sp. FL0543]
MSSDPDYIGYRLEIFVGAFTAVEIAAVALRFYARTLTVRSFGADDWLVAASLLGQIVAGAVAIGERNCDGCEQLSELGLIGVAAVEQGAIGYHVGYLTETNPEAITLLYKYLFVFSAWYCATIGLSKLAICITYRRLFPQRSVFIVLCIIAAILIAAPTATLIAGFAACKPFSANWAPPDVQASQCIDKKQLLVWSTLPHILTDVILLILPLPIIWRLQIKTKLKAALTVIFLIGSMGLGTSILRFLTFNNTSAFTDAPYNAVELVIWTIAEPGVYLISACVMMYRPLLGKSGAGFLSSSYVGNSRPGARSSRSTPAVVKLDDALIGGGRVVTTLQSRNRSGGFAQLRDENDGPLVSCATVRGPPKLTTPPPIARGRSGQQV